MADPTPAQIEAAAKAAWMALQGLDDQIAEHQEAMEDDIRCGRDPAFWIGLLEEDREREAGWPDWPGFSVDADDFRRCAKAALLAAKAVEEEQG